MNTPRTDAFEKQRIVEATTNDISTEAWADFARQLERELNELHRQNEQLREALTHICEQGWIEHEPDCAEDDTCSCTGASLVRKAL